MRSIIRTARAAMGEAILLPLLTIAACAGAPEPEPAPPGEPSVSIDPRSGPVGTGVQIQAAGFPAGATVEIGFGPPRSEYTVLTRATTTAEGRVQTVVSVPDWAEAGRDYVFVVADAADHEPKVISEEFRVTG